MIDASTPASMSLAGEVTTFGQARDVWPDNGLSYVADGDAGRSVVDSSNLAAMSVIAQHPAGGGSAAGVQVVGETVYLAAGSGGLRIFQSVPEPGVRPCAMAVFVGLAGLRRLDRTRRQATTSRP